MSRPHVLPLVVPLVAGTSGEAVTVYHLTDKVIQVYAYGTGTFQVQYTTDGTNWNAYGTFSALSTIELPFYCKQVRLYCVVIGTATSANIAGLQQPD